TAKILPLKSRGFLRSLHYPFHVSLPNWFVPTQSVIADAVFHLMQELVVAQHAPLGCQVVFRLALLTKRCIHKPSIHLDRLPFVRPEMAQDRFGIHQARSVQTKIRTMPTVLIVLRPRYHLSSDRIQ